MPKSITLKRRTPDEVKAYFEGFRAGADFVVRRIVDHTDRTSSEIMNVIELAKQTAQAE